MRVTSYQTQSDGLRIETSEGTLQLIAYAARIIRVRYFLASPPSPQESLMIVAQPIPQIGYEVHETPDMLIFTTAALEIQIQKESAAFTYCDRQGQVLTREPEQGGKTLIPVSVFRSLFDEMTVRADVQGADGTRVKVENVKKVLGRQAYHTRLEFVWNEGEALYGLGSHEEGFFNLRGTHQDLYQENLKAVVPMLVSTNGYGILPDCYSLMTFHDDEQGSFLWSDIHDELDFYFLYGPEFDQIIHGFRFLTGKVPLLPQWTFGYLQSKERYHSQEELLAVAREYRQRQISLDGIVLDWHSWPGDLWGQKSLDPERFPQSEAMMEELHRLQVRLMISIWPTMQNHGPDQQEMLEQGFLLGDQATYYVRFFQYGTFLPLFRSHGTDTPREVWRFGEPGSRFYDTLVTFIRLRYHLLPYLYSLAARVTHEGYTMLRALAFDFRQDSQVYNLADQYLFGPAFLVSPVTEPMYYLPRSQPLPPHPQTRQVYLPTGCDWYDFWTGRRFTGAQTVDAHAPLEILPLFVRAGSIVPFGPDIQSTAEARKNASLLVRIYQGQDATFRLYEDEGNTYNYENGAFSTIDLYWDDAKKRLLLGKRQGTYAGMPMTRTFSLLLVSEHQGTGVDSSRTGTKEITYDGNPLSVEMSEKSE